MKKKRRFYAFDPPPKKNGHEFQSFYIRPHSGVDSGQWDWGITRNEKYSSWEDDSFEQFKTFVLARRSDTDEKYTIQINRNWP